MLLFAITLLTFFTLLAVFYSLLHTYSARRGAVEMRLRALDQLAAGRTDIDEELAKPFRQRVLSPFAASAAAAVSRFAPDSVRRLVEQKLAAAGGFGGMGPSEFILMSGFLGMAFPALTVLITVIAGAPANKTVGLALIALAAGMALPFFLLNRKIAERRKSMQKDLPDVLDLLTVSVEAGLGFDGALAKVSEKMKGALVDEFTRVLQEIRIGVSRRDAIQAMGARCNVEDVALFATSIVQADQLGVSIGNVLRVQSASMRDKRRQRVQEQAMKAPVKMLLPMVFFIFPTIFVILLGPAAIQIFNTFSQR